jgi:hypothetical protein
VEASAGVFTRKDSGYVYQQDGDVAASTSTSFALLGVSLAPRWRLSRPFSAGAYAAWAWANLGAIGTASSDGSHEDMELTLWHLEAEGRWHPLGTFVVDPWVGVDLGLAGLRDTVEKYGVGGQFAGRASATRLSPVGGLALGVDVHLLSVLAVGLETRVSLQSFGHMPSVRPPEEVVYAQFYGTHVAWSLGLTGTFLAGPRSEPEPAD